MPIGSDVGIGHLGVGSGGLDVGDGVMSECTALLGQRSGFGGVLDSGFSSCAVPTY